MILYFMKEDYNNKLVVGYAEVLEKPKTFKIINSYPNIYTTNLSKEYIDNVHYSCVFSHSRERAIEVFKKYLEDKLEAEIKLNAIKVKRLKKQIDNIREGI